MNPTLILNRVMEHINDDYRNMYDTPQEVFDAIADTLTKAYNETWTLDNYRALSSHSCFRSSIKETRE